MQDWQTSWQRAWAGIAPSADSRLLARLLERLLAAWSEPQRRYHTLQHLGECIGQLQAHAAAAVRPAEVELALWFHDAVYDVQAHDNEARSADWAALAVREAGGGDAAAERLHALVMATRHDGAATTPDAALLVDIDLAILGAPAARFDEYETQVGAEYAWVPVPAYRAKRREILAGFLARPRLFETAALHDALEAQARRNLGRSIDRLSA